MKTTSFYFVGALSSVLVFLVGCASPKSLLHQTSSVPVHLPEENHGGNDASWGQPNQPIALVDHQRKPHLRRLLKNKQAPMQGAASSQVAKGSGEPSSPTNPVGPFYDSQEFLRDGGDAGPLAVRLNDRTLKGLQPEDTVVHYKTASGNVEVQASNQVAVYAPRFRSVRQVSGALAGGRSIGIAAMDRPVGTVRVDQPLPGLVMRDTVEIGHADVARGLDAMRDRARGVPVDGVQQVNMAGNVIAALVNLTSEQAFRLQGEQKTLLHQFANAAVTYQLDECLEVAVQNFRTPSLVSDRSVDGFTIYEFDEGQGRLEISKFADREDAKPGDVITFGIRIENVGDGVVNEVAVVDNLTTRLEYIEDSFECEAMVEFDSVDNEAQSLKLQWTLQQPLKVGESVTIQFKCRVR